MPAALPPRCCDSTAGRDRSPWSAQNRSRPISARPFPRHGSQGGSDLASLLLRPADVLCRERHDPALVIAGDGIDRANRSLSLDSRREHCIRPSDPRTRCAGEDAVGAGAGPRRAFSSCARWPTPIDLKAALRPGAPTYDHRCRLHRTGGRRVRSRPRRRRHRDRAGGTRAGAGGLPAALSDFFQRRHAAGGVRIILDAAVEAFEGTGGRATGVRLDWTAGRSPATRCWSHRGRAERCACPLGRADVRRWDRGRCRGPNLRSRSIQAIGDCTRRPLPLYQRTGRLESVPNALEQAKQAAAALCGRAPPAPEVPWFWSDQYESRLQIAGLPFDVAESAVRGDPATGSFAIFHLDRQTARAGGRGGQRARRVHGRANNDCPAKAGRTGQAVRMSSSLRELIG